MISRDFYNGSKLELWFRIELVPCFLKLPSNSLLPSTKEFDIKN